MTIGNIHIQFRKIITLGRPWGVIGGPWDCLVRSYGALGASWILIGDDGGLLGALVNPTAKFTSNSDVGRSNDVGKANRISTCS